MTEAEKRTVTTMRNVILYVMGTRPEAVKLAAVTRSMRAWPAERVAPEAPFDA
jgi:hypothetical protein